jgi:hypothetical protein
VATEDLFRVANLLGTFRWTVGVFFFALFSVKKVLGVLLAPLLELLDEQHRKKKHIPTFGLVKRSGALRQAECGAPTSDKNGFRAVARCLDNFVIWTECP